MIKLNCESELARVCAIVPQDSMRIELERLRPDMLLHMPLAVFALPTPALLLAISGSSWESHICSVRLVQLYTAALQVLQNTEDSGFNELASPFLKTQRDMLQEILQPSVACSALADARTFTLRWLRLAEYAILSTQKVPQTLWQSSVVSFAISPAKDVPETCMQVCSAYKESLLHERRQLLPNIGKNDGDWLSYLRSVVQTRSPPPHPAPPPPHVQQQ